MFEKRELKMRMDGIAKIFYRRVVAELLYLLPDITDGDYLPEFEEEEKNKCQMFSSFRIGVFQNRFTPGVVLDYINKRAKRFALHNYSCRELLEDGWGPQILPGDIKRTYSTDLDVAICGPFDCISLDNIRRLVEAALGRLSSSQETRLFVLVPAEALLDKAFVQLVNNNVELNTITPILSSFTGHAREYVVLVGAIVEQSSVENILRSEVDIIKPNVVLPKKRVRKLQEEIFDVNFLKSMFKTLTT